jgi:hypothetical protein
MKTVYWAARLPGEINHIYLTPKLGQTLFDYIRKDNELFTEEWAKMYLSCPAASPSLKNIIRVPNEIKVNFFYENNNMTVTVNDDKIKGPLKQSFIKNLLMNRSIKDKSISLQYDIFLYCEDDLEVEQIHPWLDNTEYSKNTASVFGKFNISKWMRPIQPTFICLSNNVTINENDALYYLKFNTEEKIKFVEFNFTREMENYISNNTALKFIKPYIKLSAIYDLFLKNKINKRMLKLIKENLV